MKEEKFVLGAWNAGLADFDAVILLRKAAIPNSDVALSTPDGKGQLTEKLLSVAGFQPDDTSAIEPSKHSKVALKEIPPSKFPFVFDKPTAVCSFTSLTIREIHSKESN